jgi:hypothetical protein
LLFRSRFSPCGVQFFLVGFRCRLILLPPVSARFFPFLPPSHRCSGFCAGAVRTPFPRQGHAPGLASRSARGGKSVPARGQSRRPGFSRTVVGRPVGDSLRSGFLRSGRPVVLPNHFFFDLRPCIAGFRVGLRSVPGPRFAHGEAPGFLDLSRASPARFARGVSLLPVLVSASPLAPCHAAGFAPCVQRAKDLPAELFLLVPLAKEALGRAHLSRTDFHSRGKCAEAPGLAARCRRRLLPPSKSFLPCFAVSTKYL